MTRSRVVVGMGAVLALAAWGPAQAEPRAVIELFTSQGCSSCPPADRILSELKNDPSLIALSLPIDYWDYLGWKDTLAIPGHAARQKAYSQARGDREVYTPQVVINGIGQALGNDRADIEKTIAQIQHHASGLKVPVHIATGEERVTVSISGGGDEAVGEVWLCPVSRSVPVGIARGENHGLTLTYTNVVRRWVKLGTWSGRSETFTIPFSSFKSAGVDAVAVIVQSGSSERPGPMLGASLASLR